MLRATPPGSYAFLPRVAPCRLALRLATTLFFFVLVFARLAAAAAAAAAADDDDDDDAASPSSAVGIYATPHASYSSSVGVLGCKINTDRVAYWPMPVDCTNVCVKLSLGARSVHLLRVDQSGGAYDVSYDAWNWLQTGRSATRDPIAGGAVAMTYENASAAACRGLVRAPGGRLPLSAANSMNFLAACLADPGSWVARSHALYNILDPVCSLGYDETCDLDAADVAAGANQPTCGHALGVPAPLASAPVYNIEYPTGRKVLASTGEPVENGGGGGGGLGGALGALVLLVVVPVGGLLAAEVLAWPGLGL